MKESIISLIAEMQEVKQAYPTLEITEVLRLFNIDAMNNLATTIEGFKYR